MHHSLLNPYKAEQTLERPDFEKVYGFKSQILDSSKLIEFADNNSKLYANGRKFFEWVKNTVGKGEIAHYKQFLLFLQCF